MQGALTRYRIIAWIVGVVLIVLVVVGMPLKYLGDNDTVVAAVGPAHGFLFMVYLVADVRPGPPGQVAAQPDAAGDAGRHDPVLLVLGRAQGHAQSWVGRRCTRRRIGDKVRFAESSHATESITSQRVIGIIR